MRLASKKGVDQAVQYNRKIFCQASWSGQAKAKPIQTYVSLANAK